MDAPEYRKTSYTSLLKFAKDVNSFGRPLRKKINQWNPVFSPYVCSMLLVAWFSLQYVVRFTTRDLNSVGRKVYIMRLQNVPLTIAVSVAQSTIIS